MKKIITHSGTFHADEILAISLIEQFYLENSIEIKRVHQPTQEELDDPEIFILDVGKELNINKRNIDHHQDINLHCTAQLVGAFIFNARIFYYMRKLIDPIDKVDRGVELANDGSISQTIANMNQLEDGFYRAKKMMDEIVLGYYKIAKLCVDGEDRYYKLTRYYDSVIINMGNYIPNWKELAEQEGILFMITKNEREPDKVLLISRNSDIIKIPQDAKNATFVHNNGFLAVFPTTNDALNIIYSLITN